MTTFFRQFVDSLLIFAGRAQLPLSRDNALLPRDNDDDAVIAESNIDSSAALEVQLSTTFFEKKLFVCAILTQQKMR